MGLDTFLTQLLEEGRVRVSAGEAPAGDELAEAGGLLAEFERAYRRDLPGEPPKLALAAAGWAAGMLYRACQFLVFRDVEGAVIEKELAAAGPAGANPATHYAVDLTFRFLPDVVKLARAASREDPLVARLLEWARQWPLSSVGIAEVGAVEIDGFAADPCLLAMYVDRIIARRDLSRLTEPRARQAIRAALGHFGELAPEVAAAVEKSELQETAP